MYRYREIENSILDLGKSFPVISIVGPRQSGKSTLTKKLFQDKPYVNLEVPHIREMAELDPAGFLANYPEGAIFDEVQRAPKILSYIQDIVDREKKKMMFVLTGSNQLQLHEQLTQSLAGRTCIFKLLPFSFHEARLEKGISPDEYILRGFFPAVVTEEQNIEFYYRNYYETYVERDVRQLISIKDLNQFRRFMKICAGRVGQILNANQIAGEVGVSSKTIQSWISILEASYILYQLPPWFDNIKKRLIKSPKLYFYDTGLVCYLLGITNKEQLNRDPLRGALFENMIITEKVKQQYNIGKDANFYFYRDSNGSEVDLIYKENNTFNVFEIKSSATFHSSFLKGIKQFEKVYPESEINKTLVYAGTDELNVLDVKVMNYTR